MNLDELLKYKQDKPDHFNFKDKEGLKFGLLTVMFYAGKGENDRNRWACSCSCGGYILASVGNLTDSNQKNSCGCERRKRKLRVTPSERKDVVEKNTGYKVLDMADGYVTSKWKFICQNNHEFSASCYKISNGYSHCPYCSRGGIDLNVEGYFYIHSVLNYRQEVIAYKYGITNNPQLRRLRQVELQSIYTLKNEVLLCVDNALLAQKIEKEFGNQFGKRYLSKAEIPDGYTETVAPKSLNIYVEWLNNHAPLDHNSFKENI